MTNNNPDITIAFCVNDAYVPYITVVMKSVMLNNSCEIITFFIVTDYMSKKNMLLLDEVVQNNSLVNYEIVYVKDVCVNHLKKGGFPVHIWYRILLPQLLPKNLHRVLYLDADTLVTGNIKELFNIDMRNKAIAACLDPQDYIAFPFNRLGYESKLRYVCSGVLLINLDYWR